MSAPGNQDPRFDRAAFGDDQLVDAHEKALGPRADEHAHYKLGPLILLFVLSGCVLYSAMYVIHYSGHFNSLIYDENALPSRGTAVVKADPIAQGKRLFNSAGACYTCHQPTGQGIPGTYPPLAGSEWVNGPDDRTIRILLSGLTGPLQVKGAAFPGAAPMPSFGTSGFNWNDEKIAAVLTYVRQEWGNKAGAITPEQVTAIHTKEGDRKEWSADELEKIH